MSNPADCGLPGIWPAMLTPLAADLRIDQAAFTAHARSLLVQGCAGLTPFGTTGEGPAFSVAERIAAVQGFVDAGIPGAQILVSASCAALTDVIELTRHAQDIGAWGILLMPPFFFKGLSEAGTVAAFDHVIQACADRPLRVVLYHLPQVAGVGLTTGVIAALLARWPDRIVAIKDSSGVRANSIAWAEAFMQRNEPGQPRLGLHVGHEPDLPWLAARGSRGAVSGLANFWPQTVRRLASTADPAATAREAAKVASLLRAVSSFTLLPALKGVMAIRSGDRGWLRVRPPLEALSEPEFQDLAEALAGIELEDA